MAEIYLTEKHRSDLHSSGISDELIEEIGFFSVDAEGANKLLDRHDINCECLVIPYPNVKDFFRLRPDGIVTGRDGKPSKYLQRAGTEPHLFAHPIVFDRLQEQDISIPILICEGEKKTLKATQDFFFEEPTFLPICFGGVWNWRKTKEVVNTKGDRELRKGYIPDVENLNVANRLIYICFDSDIEIKAEVQNAEAELSTYLIARGAIRVASIRIPYTGTKVGIDDYLVEHGKEKFRKLIDAASSNHLIQAYIKLIRKLPGKTATEKLDLMVSLLLKDQKATGQFFHDNNGTYYFINRTKRILQLEETSYQMEIANQYGLYRDTGEFKSIHTKMQEYAVFNGKEINIKNVAHYDVSNKQSYIYNNDGQIFIISTNQEVGSNDANNPIRIENNGYNNVFFKHRDYSPITYYNKSKNYFQKYVLDVCNFQQNENTILTPNHQRFLFTVWFYSLFYPNLLPTKPILVMTGDYGSGKSTIQRLVGKLLFGPDFNVSTIQSERDFLTSVINKYYLVYDNVDINEEWIRNAIASLSTGFKIEVRKLYTTMEMFQANPISYLAINSMGQSLYKRPDVANRLLIFRTKRIENFIPTHVLERNLLENRDRILSEVFDNLKEINRYVDDHFTYTGKFRMADFANLGLKISTAMNNEGEFKTILDILSHEQTTLPLEDSPLIDLIEKWLSKPEWQPIYISTGDLYAEFTKIANESKLHFPFKSTAGLGRALAMSLENLKHLYRIDCRRGRANKIVWMIEHK